MTSLLSPPGRALLWRVHGLAALLASPLLLIALITGLIYLPTPQVEAWQRSRMPAASAGPTLPLDQLLAAGRAAAPADLQLQQVLTPAAAGEALRLRFVAAAPGGHHAPQGALWLFLDPASAAELGRQPEAERYGVWAAQLHAQLRQGEAWRWLVELAATALLLMLVSGLLLALPLRGRGLRRWHALGGLALALLTAAITLTGLTWSERAGAQIRALRDGAGWAPPRPPTELRASSAGGSAETVWRAAQAERPGQRLLLSPPRQADGLWRVSLGERDRPWQRLELLVDASDGRVRWRSEWADLSGFARLTAVGIPFHRGELGLWNQGLLALFALGLLGSLISGLLMLRRRLRQGGRLWVRGTQPAPGRWAGAVLLLAASALFPLLLVPLALILLAECWPAFRTPGRRPEGTIRHPPSQSWS